MAPIIDRTNLQTTTVRVGKSIHLDVDVQGEPAPTIKWFLDGVEITNSMDHYTVENVDYNTQFYIKSGTRKTSGRYKIVATNEHGKDEAEVDLLFLGPPGTPMGKRGQRIPSPSKMDIHEGLSLFRSTHSA